MKITRTSRYSGITRTLDLDITEEQILKRNQGELIQNAFPQLSNSEREFYLSGITDEEWGEMHGGSEDDDEEEQDEA